MGESTVTVRRDLRELGDALRAAAGALRAAEGVSWSGPAAGAYGRSVDGLAATVRSGTAGLGTLEVTVARHLAIVEEAQRQDSLTGAGPFCTSAWGTS